jgi:hypothetical protein
LISLARAPIPCLTSRAISPLGNFSSPLAVEVLHNLSSDDFPFLPLLGRIIATIEWDECKLSHIDNRMYRRNLEIPNDASPKTVYAVRVAFSHPNIEQDERAVRNA